MNKSKSHRSLRIVARIISFIGILFFLLSLFGFGLLVYKTIHTFVSDSIAFPILGIIFGTGMFGIILYLLASAIVVLCDIANNTLNIANKEPSAPTQPQVANSQEHSDHTKYLPKI